MDKKFTRTNSICPTPDTLLLNAVKANNCDQITRLINSNPNLVHHLYEEYEHRPILTIACSNFVKKIKSITVETLIKHGANVENSSPTDSNYTALHFATYHNRVDLMEKIIEGQPLQINVEANGNNALLTLIKDGAEGRDEATVVKCAEVLLKNGIKVNHLDSKNFTAILWAAKKNYHHIVKAILDSGQNVDIDTVSRPGQKTARELIVEKKLYDGTLPEKIDPQVQSDKEILFIFLRRNDEMGFLDFRNGDLDEDLANSDNTNHTLLQLSCEKGFTEATEHLLEKGANPYKTLTKNSNLPLETSADRGFYQIFQILLDAYKIDNKLVPGDILITLLKNIDGLKTPMINHEKCYKFLIDFAKENPNLLDVNYINPQDHNNALHYAVRYANEEQIRELLSLGASFAIRNKFGVLPIHDIDPDVMEKHLDDCVECDINSKAIEKKEFKITLNLQSLVPPSTTHPAAKYVNHTDSVLKIDVADDDGGNWEATPETNVVLFMSKSAEYRHLLKHPVIVAFLFMKWHRIYWLFISNLVFYLTFCLSLGLYTFLSYANFQFDENNHTLKTFSSISHCILVITFALLLFREIFQMVVSPRGYFKNFENYLEMLLIALVAAILLINSPSKDTRKQLSSVSILLAAFELILLLGQHPKLSTNVEMLRRVSLNFFKLLLWYSILILAFVLSFYIMFSEPSSDDHEDNLFANPGNTFFKTIIMLTGEFDAGSITFNTVLSKVIFCSFIFMITIILLNLLNGLAVSDTQLIKNEAELFGHIARAKYVSYVERMLLSNLFPTHLFQKIQAICCCLPSSYDLIIKPFQNSNCLLKNYLNKYQIEIFPNNHGLIYVPRGKSNKCSENCSKLYLDQKSVRRAESIVQQKREKMKAGNQEFCERCAKLMEKLINKHKRG